MKTEVARLSPLGPKAYFSEDTIAALASGTGGAITVLRLSGPRAFEILNSLSLNREFAPRVMTRAMLNAPGGVSDGATKKTTLDDAMVAVFVAPHSFTGEDVAELFLHGGSVVAVRVMQAVIALGARQALPGEYSFRAVRNGKMTVTQAQAVADLIEAKNTGAADLALEKLSGSQHRLVGDVAEKLRRLVTLGEVGIDFSDQDVDEVSLKNLKTQVRAVLDVLKKLASSFERGTWLQEGFKVAFVGAPNAGKSSLFNALLGEDRSIVSEIPGTTRDVVRETLELRDSVEGATWTFNVQDTAGLRGALDPIEKMGIERTRKALREADLVIWVVDGATGLDDSVKNIPVEIEGLHDVLGAGIDAEKAGPHCIRVLNKADLMGQERVASEVPPGFIVTACPPSESHGVSGGAPSGAALGVAPSGALGIDTLAAAMADWARSQVARDEGEVLLTRLDHQQAVSAAVECLERAMAATEHDLFAADLWHALRALEGLIGETLPDDVLGRIFSEFCIGK